MGSFLIISRELAEFGGFVEVSHVKFIYKWVRLTKIRGTQYYK